MKEKIGFIVSTFPDEKRVPLLPRDVAKINKDIVIEKDFAKTLGIPDSEYIQAGCTVLSREDIFKTCDNIFCLKLLQKEDYELLRNGHFIIGWTHPNGSGSYFFNNICKKHNIALFDVDTTFPALYHDDQVIRVEEVPLNFCSMNSFMSGQSSVLHALMSFGSILPTGKKVAVLSCGNVAQGAFSMLIKLGFDTKIFYRKTMNEFYETISDYDIIVNGIEIAPNDSPIIDKVLWDKIKKNALVIDSAADAGNAITNSVFTSHSKPIITIDGVHLYCINNCPSLVFRDVSSILSEIFTKHIYNLDLQSFKNKIKG